MKQFDRRRAAVAGVAAAAAAFGLVAGGASIASASASTKASASTQGRPTTTGAPAKVKVSHAQLHSAGQVNLGAARSPASAQANSGTSLPGEHYKVADPDRSSVFSPGGANAGSAKLSSAVGNHAVSASSGAGTVGFVGITGPAQAKVNGNGDLEPPDQGLCSDGSTTIEFVNNALQAYSTSGASLAGPIASTTVFGLPTTDSLSDPRCSFDAPTHRWFLTEFTVGTTNAAGQATSPSTQYIAVSDTSNGLGSYHIYSIDTTDATTSGCPCFGDYDMIGADASGFYITTNEFGLSSGAYNGSIIYAVSKKALETSNSLGSPSPTVVTYRLLSDAFGQPYHVSPSSTPPGGAYAPNREYFVETNSNANQDNHLVVYTMQDTKALTTGGTPFLTNAEISSESYAFPPVANQKAGPIPLGKSVNNPEGVLQADFNAIQEVTYTGGQLYAEADTAAAGGKDGIAWFILKPATGTTPTTVAHQGYVTSPGLNLLYPDIAVDSTGKGFLVFSMAGASAYPSAADLTFGPTGPSGSISTVAAGTAPEDGFTCYAALVGPGYGGCRWGDYSAGVAANGRIFMATEYIPPTSRDTFTNWGTYVWSSPTP